MKQLIQNYSYNASTKKITFTDFTTNGIVLSRILLITDVTAGVTLYQFNTSGPLASVSTNALTLASVPTGTANSDSLQIYYDTQTGDPTYDTPPIPLGAATAANQTSGNTSLTSIATNTGRIPAQGAAAKAASMPVTLATDQPAVPVSGTFWQTTQPVSLAALPSLVAGSAKVGIFTTDQTTHGTSDLVAADITKIGGSALTIGQQAPGASLPVVLPASQITSLTPPAAITGFALDTSVNGLLVAQNATAASLSGPMVQGLVTTTAPSYTTAKTGALSLTPAGALRVDASATTQPVSLASLPALATGANTIGAISNTGFNATQNGTWTMQPGNTANTTAWLFAGNKSNNAAAPGATNFGALTGLANAAVQTWTEGDMVLASMDLSGNQRVTLGTLIAGEDLTVGVLKTEQRFSYATINSATTTTVKSAAGFLHTITIAGGTAGAITIYDNTAGSGTTIIPAFTPGSVSAPVTLTLDVAFSTGLTIVTAAATVISLSYR
jgi:hypothetical protein